MTQPYTPEFRVRVIESDIYGGDLDDFLGSKHSSLCGLGGIINALGRYYKINQLFILALMIHESAWGQSHFAQTRNNLCGWGAVDKNPDKAWHFHNREECVLTVCKFLDLNYLTKKGKYYKGGTIGEVGRVYASDPMWAVGLCKLMNQIRKHIDAK